MLNSLANALTAVKQRAIEATAKRLINQKIIAFGSVTSLQIDSKQRTISAELALKGEAEPIAIKIGAYELIEENGVSFISCRDLHSSKEWIGHVLNEYVAGQRFKVPHAVKMAL
jgi:hypothetical protein